MNHFFVTSWLSATKALYFLILSAWIVCLRDYYGEKVLDM